MKLYPRKRENCSAHPICSPMPQETWVNGTMHQFTWNPLYAGYQFNDTLSLYLYHKDSSYRLIKAWPGLEKDLGAYTVTVDDSWFPRQLQENKQNWTMYGYLFPPDWDPQIGLNDSTHRFPGFNWTVQQSVIFTGANESQVMEKNTSGSFSSFPVWGIVVLTLCSVTLAVVLVMFAFWCYQKQRFPFSVSSFRHTSSATPPRSTTGTQRDAEMAQHITTPTSVVKEKHNMELQGASPSSYTSNNTTHWQRRSSILTSSDAALLGDTFRQALHTPSWDEAEQEERRRQLSNELLRQQLQNDEGSSIKFSGERRIERSAHDTQPNSAENISSASA
ncbi:hypothetical protein DM01DRAFT_1372310 [Hesseltinella vesiculosa]|uniref:Uncharacterized protein n=1 Tax=Hesseltinella vesiculosa TaxID=101127 RepID=A0A1X2GQJ8_9FUNG|nr:hypothetical protein DM01DRAFT_1372310 [Hesseltinella vesiculosa]